MTDKHLKFLDYILPILSEKYPSGNLISFYAILYEKETNRPHTSGHKTGRISES